MTKIVCYAGGTCGDILTSLIDPTGATINSNGSMQLPIERSRLKKPNLLTTDQDKLDYINQIGLLYNSIPSHDAEFHIKQKHSFLGIVIDHFDTALWAATRFKQFHRPHVWEEMQQVCGAKTIADYAEIMLHLSRMIKEGTDNTISLEVIRAGSATQHLKLLNISVNGEELYQHWLQNEHNKI